MKDRKLKEYICRQCGEHFFTYGQARKLLCDKCRKKNRKKRQEEQNEQRKKIPPVRKMRLNKSLWQITRELERYNAEHKTHLSYGQYVLMMQEGDRQ